MTKSELIEAVANKLKLPKGKAELIVNCVFDSMEAALRRGERIEIRGFGSFEIRHYGAYKGRNPRTGDEVDVRPKRLPFFKVGKELKERVNDGRGSDGQPAVTSQENATGGVEGGSSSSSVAAAVDPAAAAAGGSSNDPF